MVQYHGAMTDPETDRRTLVARWRALIPDTWTSASAAMDYLWADEAAREAILRLRRGRRDAGEKPNARQAGWLCAQLQLQRQGSVPFTMWGVGYGEKQRLQAVSLGTHASDLTVRWYELLRRPYTAGEALANLMMDDEARRIILGLADDEGLGLVSGRPTKSTFERWLMSHRRALVCALGGGRVRIVRRDVPPGAVVVDWSSVWEVAHIDATTEAWLEQCREERAARAAYRQQPGVIPPDQCRTIIAARWRALVSGEVTAREALDVLWADDEAREAISDARSTLAKPTSRAMGKLLASIQGLAMRRVHGAAYWRAS